jgi:hypothetical protein
MPHRRDGAFYNGWTRNAKRKVVKRNADYKRRMDKEGKDKVNKRHREDGTDLELFLRHELAW